MGAKLDRPFLDKLRNAEFERVSDYLVHICGLVVRDYSLFGKKLPKNEPDITGILIAEYLNEYRNSCKMDSFRFDPEIPEGYIGNGKYKGRVDIRILLKCDFEKNDAYFIAECKRIDGNARLNSEYVNEGVSRFLTKKYSSYYGRNFMLGYVIKSINIAGNTTAIKGIQDNALSLFSPGSFDFLQKNGVTESYRCMYQINGKVLELRHIFADFSGIA